MRIYYEENMNDKAVVYGEKLISFKKINNKIKSDAYLFIARSSINLGETKRL